METLHLGFVRKIAETGSISNAARELGMTQSALTKIVARIEDQAGAKLFERGPRGVTPTPCGEVFLERTARLMQQVAGLTSELRAMRSGMSGTVVLGVGQFWVGHILPGVLARLSTERPDIRVRLRTGQRDDLLAQLVLGEIDIMLGRITDDLPSEFSATPITELRLCLLVREGHPLARLSRGITLADLAPFGWVLPPETDPTFRQLDRAIRGQGEVLEGPRLEAVSQRLTLAVLENSDLITAESRSVNDPVEPGFHRLRADWLERSTDVGAIRVAERHLQPCCGVLLDRIVEAARAGATVRP